MRAAYFDGFTTASMSTVRIGGIVLENNLPVLRFSKILDKNFTIHEAEYAALIEMLEQLIEAELNDVLILGDNKLVINQVNGHWEVNQEHLIHLHQRAAYLKSQIPMNTLQWITSKDNLACAYSKPSSSKKGKPQAFHGTIERVSDSTFRVFGSNCYDVNLEKQTCTCPAYVLQRIRPCKHIISCLSYEMQN